MQQRQPRLGDIVDDYCPRERRVTNHAVVAMVGDDIRQTRCTTCDSEHEFKQAKVPAQRRKKEAEGALYNQVLNGLAPKVVQPGTPTETEGVIDDPPSEFDDAVTAEGDVAAAATELDANGEPVVEVDGPVHRRLIRATLPRLGNEPPARREPEFTMRTAQQARPGRPGKPGFKAGPRSGGQGAQPNGNRGGAKRHGPAGAGGGFSGRPAHAGPGHRPARPGQHGSGGKKRSR
jgi:hypothetical protein